MDGHLILFTQLQFCALSNFSAAEEFPKLLGAY